MSKQIENEVQKKVEAAQHDAPPDIHTAPLQEIYDYIVRKLDEQGEQSRMDAATAARIGRPTTVGSCAYRGAGGSRCAVGHIIPDASYKLLFEGKSALFVCDELNVEGYRAGFLYRVQKIHDHHWMDRHAWLADLAEPRREIESRDRGLGAQVRRHAVSLWLFTD